MLNTSRWTNALGLAGLLRRAYVEAWTFAQQRRAFGAAIGRYPLVLEALAEADWELSQGLDTDKPAALAVFLNRHLRPSYDPMEDGEYLDRITRLAESL